MSNDVRAMKQDSMLPYALCKKRKSLTLAAFLLFVLVRGLVNWLRYLFSDPFLVNMSTQNIVDLRISNF